MHFKYNTSCIVFRGSPGRPRALPAHRANRAIAAGEKPPRGSGSGDPPSSETPVVELPKDIGISEGIVPLGEIDGFPISPVLINGEKDGIKGLIEGGIEGASAPASRRILTIPGFWLFQPTSVVLEQDEIPHQLQEASSLKDPFEQDFQLGCAFVFHRLAGNSPPGLEPFPPGSKCSQAGLKTIGNNQKLVEGEEGRKFGSVGLKLVVGSPDGGLFVGRVFQLDNNQGQTVDEEHDVRPTKLSSFHHCELIDGEPVVVLGILKVQHADQGAGNGAIGSAVFHRHTLGEHPMESTVTSFQCGAFRVGDPMESVLQCLSGEVRVEPC